MKLTEITNQIDRGENELKPMPASTEIDFGNSKIMVVNITKTYNDACKRGLSVYNATRGIWYFPDDYLEKAKAVEYVLGCSNNIIRGVYKPKGWYPALPDNTGLLKEFKKYGLYFKPAGRYAFTGIDSKPEWINKKLDIYFNQPVKFINFEN